MVTKCTTTTIWSGGRDELQVARRGYASTYLGGGERGRLGTMKKKGKLPKSRLVGSVDIHMNRMGTAQDRGLRTSLSLLAKSGGGKCWVGASKEGSAGDTKTVGRVSMRKKRDKCGRTARGSTETSPKAWGKGQEDTLSNSFAPGKGHGNTVKSRCTQKKGYREYNWHCDNTWNQ